jgi:hypothetical protein
MLLQMDNCVEDSINSNLLMFMLTVKEVFGEVKLGCFMVGHTHENIDGCFGYLSKKLKEKSNYILANLMKACMVLQDKNLSFCS